MKTVIEMARSVGATAYTNRHYPDRPTHTFNVDQLEAFAELVRADERKPLTDEDDLDWEEGGSLKDLVKAIESKLKEKNDGREWQDLTDDEMLMIYGQNHEGKKYNLGRMVQQALKDKNT